MPPSPPSTITTPAERIQFAPGTASYEFTTTLAPGIPRSYVLRILAGQVLYISVLSEKEVSVAVLGPEGTALPVTRTGRPGGWSVDIPRTGDYTLVLQGEGEAKVTVYIPPLSRGVSPSAIIEIPAEPVEIAAWSPDGTHLAYYVAGSVDGAFRGIEVRSIPDLRLEGRWSFTNVLDLTWTPGGDAILFVFDRGDTSSIGMARLGEDDWEDLLPGEKAHLAVSLGKAFVDWLDGETLAFRVHSGAGSESLYSLNIATGELRPLVNVWGSEVGTQCAVPPPYPDVFGTFYLFSPDRRWLAVTSWGMGVPHARVLKWPGPAEPLELSSLADTPLTEALSWTTDTLAFVGFPADAPEREHPTPGLYALDIRTGAVQPVMDGAFRAAFSPAGDRLAVLLLEESGSNVFVAFGLLTWPEGELLARHPASSMRITGFWDLWSPPLPALVWSPDGNVVGFKSATGGIVLVDREGRSRSVDGTETVKWFGWSADGRLALLRGKKLWVSP